MNPIFIEDLVAESQREILDRRNAALLLLSGDGVFTTIQGEGPAAGTPATFIRLAACNLKCGVNGGWKCDSAYTWDFTGVLGTAYDKAAEARPTPVSDVLRQVPGDPNLVVVTGGEPLLQDAALAVLLKQLRDRGHTIHMETNGTLAPTHTAPLVDLFVCSPKLASSGNDAEQRALNPLWLLHQRVAFKFVITREHRFADLREVARLMGVRNAAAASNVWLMPEGITPHEVTEGARALVPICIRYGFKLGLRQHILLFGDQRGT